MRKTALTASLILLTLVLSACVGQRTAPSSPAIKPVSPTPTPTPATSSPLPAQATTPATPSSIPASTQPSPSASATPPTAAMYGEVRAELIAPVFTVHLYRYFGYYPVWVKVKNGYVKIEAGRAIPVGTLKNVVVEVKIGDAPWQKQNLGDIGPGESKEAEFTRTFETSWLEGILHYEKVRVHAKVSWLDPKTGRIESWSSYDEGQIFGKNWVLWRLGLEYPCLYGPTWITPADDTVQHFVKSLGVMVTSSDEGALRAAAMIWDALCELGVKYVSDPNDPLFDEEDYIQFASQTLSRKAGDCDDLSILFATCLEAVGIETGLVAVPGHVFPFFILPESGSIVFVEATLLPDHSFWDAVEYGGKEYSLHESRNEIIFMVYTHDCWDMGFSPWG